MTPLQPIRVATGFDEDGMMVLVEEQRLLAVLDGRDVGDHHEHADALHCGDERAAVAPKAPTRSSARS